MSKNTDHLLDIKEMLGRVDERTVNMDKRIQDALDANGKLEGRVKKLETNQNRAIFGVAGVGVFFAFLKSAGWSLADIVHYLPVIK